MKTLEEKIKLAKEALESGSYDKNTIEYLFPELKESEDEKTKRILHSISSKMSFHLRDIFTEEEFQCFDAWSNAWLEKQGQKSAEWHREDEQNLNACLGYIPDEFLRRWLTDIIYAKCDKSAWSEEDESMYVRTLGILGKCYMGQLPTKVEDELKWFKFLKNKL